MNTSENNQAADDSQSPLHGAKTPRKVSGADASAGDGSSGSKVPPMPTPKQMLPSVTPTPSELAGTPLPFDAQPVDPSLLDESQTLWPMGQLSPRVLLVSSSRIERDTMTARLLRQGMEVEAVSSPADAIAAVATDRFDLAIVQRAIGGKRGVELMRNLRELDENLGFVLTARKASIEDAVEAMQQGVLDFLVGKLDGVSLCKRIGAAVNRSRQRRHERMRVERLKRMCREVDSSREEITEEVSSLCNDLATAYQELTEQMAHVGLATEFNSLIRQELDLESLLRTVLEFLLAKIGPTNAAIFLPSTSGDYSLGAYVNYDCPRDTAEVLLEHLAGVIPERFENEPSLVMMRSEQALFEYLSENADWLDGHAVGCVACVEDDECLAVLTLFRDRQTGFSSEHETQLNVISDLFAKQLSRVIHVHHRHLPKEAWGTDNFDDELPDDMADDLWDDDVDDHGMAA